MPWTSTELHFPPATGDNDTTCAKQKPCSQLLHDGKANGQCKALQTVQAPKRGVSCSVLSLSKHMPGSACHLKASKVRHAITPLWCKAMLSLRSRAERIVQSLVRAAQAWQSCFTAYLWPGGMTVY